MNFKIVSALTVIFLFQLFILGSIPSVKAQTNSVLVRGFVTDETSNERLTSVFISVDSVGVAVTDSKGFFSFNIAHGYHIIEAKLVGYETQVKYVTIAEDAENINLFFKLKAKPFEISTVTISGERYSREIKYNTYELQQGELNKIPQLGEPDVFRAIQSLPGVSTIGDHSTQIFLRGGNFDETLVSIDGVPLLNPYHIGGIFGIINTDFVHSEVVYPSNYPPNYGGALSGVLNINSRTGKREEYKGAGSIGLFSSKAYLEGPLLKGSFLISARRTYFDLLSSVSGLGNFPYYFFDLYGKYTLPLDDKNLIEISGLYTRDIYEIFKEKEHYEIISKESDPAWGNNLLNFKFTHFFEDKNYLDFQIYYSESLIKADAKARNLYSVFYNPDYEPDVRFEIVPSNDSINTLNINNFIKNISGKIEFVYNFTGQTINAGFEIKKIRTNYNWNIYESDLSGLIKQPLEKVFFDLAPNPYNKNDETFVYSNYFLDKIQVTKRLSVTPGYRLEYITKPDEFLFSSFLLLNYNLKEDVDINLSYGKYYQYLYIIKDKISDGIYAPFSLYFISANEGEIASSHHLAAGIKFYSLFNFLDFEVEGYYKKRENISSTNDDRTGHIFVDGYAAGLDFLLKKDNGNVTGWLGYSLSRSVKRGINYSYFSNFDRTHNIKIFLNYKPFESLSLNAFWTLGTGLPYTPIIGKFLRASNYFNNNYNTSITVDDEGRVWEIIEGKRNSQRLKSLHRLDIGLNGSFIWGSLLVKPYLVVMNVYNSSNPFFYEGSVYDDSSEDGQKRTSFILPSIGITVEF